MAGVNLPGESGQMSFFDDYEMENIELLTNEVLTYSLMHSLTHSLMHSLTHIGAS